MSARAKVNLVAIVVWAALVAVLMLFFDESMAHWVKAHPMPPTAWDVMNQVRWPGHFGFTIAVALLLTWRHALRWRAGVILLASGALSGLVVVALKWSVGRERPVRDLNGAWKFNHFRNGVNGIFDQTGLSFPSGDVALAFATAACLAIWFPRWQPLFYLWAILTAAQRVLTNSHYLSEVTAAAGIGILSVMIVARAFRSWLLQSWNEEAGALPVVQND